MSAVLNPAPNTSTESAVGVPIVKLLIGGQAVASQSTLFQPVINPATQAVLAQVPMGTAGDVDLAVASAKEAFKTWRLVPVQKRAAIFSKLRQLILANLPHLAATLTSEHGKTLPDAEGDVLRGLEVVEQAASMMNLQQGDFMNDIAGGVDVYSIREPIGVCAGIAPFNFPAMIPLWMFPMAIATGNTFVLKPSEQDPLTPMLLAELAHQAGLPPGVLNVVHGGKAVVDAICTHPDIRAIQFVGSTQIGTHVYNLGSQHGKRVAANMGAKNHAVIMPDANKDQTLNALAGAAFGAGGQRCMATSVAVFVGEAQNWIPDLVAKSQALKLNAGHEKGADISPVISTKARARIEGLIESGVQQGATLALDGRNPNVPGYEQGNFIGPTIFSGVKPGMRIYDEEIFGPVLVCCDATSLDDAIAFVNANPNGNGTAIFTQSGAVARKFQAEIGAGQVGINIPIPVPVSFFSFTGSRASKLGTLGPNGKEIIAFYTQTKTVTSRWFDDSAVSTGVNTTISLK